MIIKKLREYILQCPYLDEVGQVNVDYLGTNAVEYTIDKIPSDTVIERYVDGGAKKQYLFVFGSMEYYGAGVLQNMNNNGFYEKVESWFEEQSRRMNLPDLGEGKEALGIEILSSAYLFYADEDKARYQIQARLIYYED